MKNTENQSAGVLSSVGGDRSSVLAGELACAKASDLSKNKELEKKSILRNALVGALRYALTIACVLIFIGSVVYIAAYGFQYVQKIQESEYLEKLSNGEIRSNLASVSPKVSQNVITLPVEKSMAGEVIEKTGVDTKTYNEYFEKKRSQIIGLQRSYPDVWGWIELPGTTINYVIMQGNDNKFYLYKSFDGKENRFGSIFADYRVPRDPMDCENTVIYGHNMNSAKTMFAPLLDFATDEEAFKNQVINIITPDALYTYTLFSVYDTPASYNYIRTDFNSDDDYVQFLNQCVMMSRFRNDSVKLTKDSKILTLSTCTVRGDGMRWAFHAVLTGISK